jgi:SOS-response transcriptional repressor LexA
MFYKKPTGVAEHTGFPNAATDASLQDLDLNQLLIHNNLATFLMRISGNDWAEQGIFHGDIAIIDRALKPRTNDLVAWIGEDFSLSYLHKVPEDGNVWGVVTSVIHCFRNKKFKGEQ